MYSNVNVIFCWHLSCVSARVPPEQFSREILADFVHRLAGKYMYVVTV